MTKGATYVVSTNIYGQFINCQKTKHFHGSSNEGLTQVYTTIFIEFYSIMSNKQTCIYNSKRVRDS